MSLGKTGEVVSEHDTRAEAEAQLQSLRSGVNSQVNVKLFERLADQIQENTHVMGEVVKMLAEVALKTGNITIPRPIVNVEMQVPTHQIFDVRIVQQPEPPEVEQIVERSPSGTIWRTVTRLLRKE